MTDTLDGRAILDAAMSERDYQKQIVELAETLGWRVYHTHDSRRSNPGFPDLVLVRDSRLVFIEVKRQSGKLSLAQKDWLTALSEVAEVTTLIARPSDWEQVASCLLHFIPVWHHSPRDTP